jgi:hypothetical protein
LVYSPVSGVVARVSDTLPDGGLRSFGSRPAAEEGGPIVVSATPPVPAVELPTVVGVPAIRHLCSPRPPSAGCPPFLAMYGIADITELDCSPSPSPAVGVRESRLPPDGASCLMELSPAPVVWAQVGVSAPPLPGADLPTRWGSIHPDVTTLDSGVIFSNLDDDLLLGIDCDSRAAAASDLSLPPPCPVSSTRRS